MGSAVEKHYKFYIASRASGVLNQAAGMSYMAVDQANVGNGTGARVVVGTHSSSTASLSGPVFTPIMVSLRNAGTQAAR